MHSSRAQVFDYLRLQNEGVWDTFIPIKIIINNKKHHGRLPYSKAILHLQDIHPKSDSQNWDQAVDFNAAVELLFMLHNVRVRFTDNSNFPDDISDTSESGELLSLMTNDLCNNDEAAATMDNDPEPKLRFLVFTNSEEHIFYVSRCGKFYDEKGHPVRNDNQTLPGLRLSHGRNYCGSDSTDPMAELYMEAWVAFSANAKVGQNCDPPKRRHPSQGFNMEIIYLDSDSSDE